MKPMRQKTKTLRGRRGRSCTCRWWGIPTAMAGGGGGWRRWWPSTRDGTVPCLLPSRALPRMAAADGVAWGRGGGGLGLWGRRRGGDGGVAQARRKKKERNGREKNGSGRPNPKSPSHASPPGATSQSRRSRWRDRLGPALRHVSSHQCMWRSLSRQCMWRDRVVLSHHPVLVRSKGLWRANRFSRGLLLKYILRKD
jgi:hypothetical protein